MIKKLPDYPLYDTVYNGEFPSEQYFIAKFDAIPSSFETHNFYDVGIKQYFIELGYEVNCVIESMNRRMEKTITFYLIHEKKHTIIKILSVFDKNEFYYKLTFLYNLKKGEISTLVNFDEIEKFRRVKKRSNINLIKMEMGHLDIEEYDLPIPEIDLELNYGTKFQKIHETIFNRLSKNYDKGIILLHGDPGTGKTTYIKYLTGLIKEKDILFIPPSMAEMLSEPSIIPFLMEHKNSILIIEDAERVISDRETTGSPSGVSNILNLTDGILGDCLNIQIIATFNMRREKIDQALLRKGRLIAEHKFEKLTVDETNKLLKHLNKDYVSNEGMVLADIFNIDVEVFKTQTGNKIGFNR